MFLKSTLVPTKRAVCVASRYLSTSRPVLALSSCRNLGLDKAWGIDNSLAINRNLTYDEIFEKETEEGSGHPDMEWHVSKNGTFAVDTGKFTGRSPKDKWIVRTPGTESAQNVWFGDINQPVDPAVFDELYESVTKHYNEDATSMYVFDGYCGAAPATQKKVRFVTEMAWQHHFVTNMFIRPKEVPSEADFDPDFTIINACKVTNQKWKEHGLNSDVFVAFNVEKKIGIIGGTWYGGEMKKGIFGMMNYWLPLEGIMSMHCSANKANDGKDSALFFGLSGTGKTTLSADPNRLLIGDDEHGWDNDGIFNFEGGCYAKTINLREENEPEIYRAIKRNALLENNTFKADKTPDFDDVSKTQNGRVSYPIEHIPNHAPDLRGDHPKVCIFLTCDAYGVLPPVAKLSPEQAMYHFLSGYTAKVAGTERGITEPTATFSACFGAAFMTLHPTRYAELLQTKLERHGTKAYLVNTGWTGGAYGVGKRMSIKDTRACIDAILDGSIENQEFTVDPLFQFNIPKALNGVNDKVLLPQEAWPNKAEYDATAKKLAGMFIENFKQFSGEGAKVDYSPYGPVMMS